MHVTLWLGCANHLYISGRCSICIKEGNLNSGMAKELMNCQMFTAHSWLAEVRQWKMSYMPPARQFWIIKESLNSVKFFETFVVEFVQIACTLMDRRYLVCLVQQGENLNILDGQRWPELRNSFQVLTLLGNWRPKASKSPTGSLTTRALL